MREQVAATVSQLPLSLNDTVLGYINYFANRGHKTIVAATERSGRYRPMIQRILDEEGVPQELIHLAQAESGFIPRAVSRKAAGGMWQFLTWRGQQYGLTQTPYTDDRMDPEKATRAAARHLHDLYNEFGDWYLAIAAYNCGPGAVEKAVERTGYADFWELRNRGVLPAETTNYVPIILAMTIMEKNAAEYGLERPAIGPAARVRHHRILCPHQPVADLRHSGRTSVGAGSAESGRFEGHRSSQLFASRSQGHRQPAAGRHATDSGEHRDSWRMHRIGPGETLATIGKHYGIAAASIVAANGLRSDEAVEGDRLLIPTGARAERHRSPSLRSLPRAPGGLWPRTVPRAKSAPSRSASQPRSIEAEAKA